jgi:hypothetical protein
MVFLIKDLKMLPTLSLQIDCFYMKKQSASQFNVRLKRNNSEDSVVTPSSFAILHCYEVFTGSSRVLGQGVFAML